MNLRDYQRKAVDAVFEKWKEHRSCVVVLPTGCGKTIVFGEVVRRILGEATSSPPPRRGGVLASSEKGNSNSMTEQAGTPALRGNRVMILAHREELIRQAADKIQKITGIEPAIEMGPHQVEDFGLLANPRIVVSSVQTQITGRMGKFPPEEFAAVIVDEAHHATSPSYREVIGHSSKPHCLIVDFVGNSGRHKLVTTAEILGGEDLRPDDEAVKVAKRFGCGGSWQSTAPPRRCRETIPGSGNSSGPSTATSPTGGRRCANWASRNAHTGGGLNFFRKSTSPNEIKGLRHFRRRPFLHCPTANLVSVYGDRERSGWGSPRPPLGKQIERKNEP